MGVTVTGKLNKAAHQFQAGDSFGFGIRIGQQYYDRKTKKKEWTNYKAVIFAKQQNLTGIAFLQSALVEGAIVEVTGDTQAIEVFDGQNGQVLSIEIHNAKLGFVHYDQPAQPQASAPAYNPQQAGAQPGYPAGNGFAPSHPTNAQAGALVGGSPATRQNAAQSAPPVAAPPAAESHSNANYDDDIPF